MNYTFRTFLFFLSILLFSFSTYGQTDFRADLEKADPISRDSVISIEDREQAHIAFLTAAIQAENDLHQLYGYLYRFYDCLKKHDYAEALSHLLNAEKIAQVSGKLSWKGPVSYRRGLLNVRMDNEEDALAAYQVSAVLCAEAGDSLCLGESLEQIGAMNSLLDKFEESKTYFEQAIPLLEKFGGSRQLATAFNNFGIRLSLQGKPSDAIPYMQRARELHHEEKNYVMESKSINNLADAYRRLKKNDLAIQTFKECVEFNKTHNFSENRVNNYLGLYFAYLDKKDYKSALDYIEQYVNLRDSLIGEETKQKIALLETNFNNAQKELELEKSQTQLAKSQTFLERVIAAFLFLSLLTGIGIWRWRTQNQQAKQQLVENQENLKRLTRMLLEKNTLLTNLEEKVSSQKKTNELPSNKKAPDEKINLYNQRILTNDDWIAFKVYFEKTYPGYLPRLRSMHPTLTEAYERLFLFIKLNLNRQEIANILGITPDTVKKTRTRLRSRLALNRNDSLEDYIQQF